MTDQAEALLGLYNALKDRRPVPIRDRPKEERRAYHAEANRKWRAKARASAESGSPEPSAAMVRSALADAAIILLATGAPGSDEIQRLLGLAFPGKSGVTGTVTAKARAGRLKPKIITPDKLTG